MTKPTWIVRFSRRRADVAVATETTLPADTRMERVRASNRREAMVLTRDRHPDHEVTSVTRQPGGPPRSRSRPFRK